jgi:hypothetical protein
MLSVLQLIVDLFDGDSELEVNGRGRHNVLRIEVSVALGDRFVQNRDVLGAEGSFVDRAGIQEEA